VGGGGPALSFLRAGLLFIQDAFAWPSL
jgi:hypothetical protein